MHPNFRPTLAVCLVLFGSSALRAEPAVPSRSPDVGGAAESPWEPCTGRARAVLVSTGTRELRLCEGGKTSRAFAVALGTGGDDKRVRGDAKTPLGTYPLGAPRASASFGTFIPLGYPTPAQRRAGFTGSDVGIHGPGRDTRFLGAVNTSVDWTLGCIAVASDREIDEVAAFVRRGPVEVTIVREFHALAPSAGERATQPATAPRSPTAR